jgi:hypothetical protein
MHTRFLAFLFVGAVGIVAHGLGCAGNTSNTSSSSSGTTSASSGSGGKGGGTGSGGTTSASNTSTAASTAASSGAGGANPCEGSIDTPCEQCAATKCHDQAKKCAATSTCMPDGTPTGGCLALVSCAASKCTKMGMLDQPCVFSNCSAELASAGGFSGEGTQNAIALGQCLNQYCMKECTN